MADTRKSLEKAAALVAKGKLEKALEAYQEAIAADPQDPLPFQRKAELLVRMGMEDDAIGCYFAAGRLYTKVEDAAKAAALYRAVLRLRPGNATARAGMEAAERRSKGVASVRRDLTPVPRARAIAMPDSANEPPLEILRDFREQDAPEPPGVRPPAAPVAEVDRLPVSRPGVPVTSDHDWRPAPRPLVPSDPDRRPAPRAAVPSVPARSGGPADRGGFEILEEEELGPEGVGIHAAPRGPFVPVKPPPSGPAHRLSSFAPSQPPPPPPPLQPPPRPPLPTNVESRRHRPALASTLRGPPAAPAGEDSGEEDLSPIIDETIASEAALVPLPPSDLPPTEVELPPFPGSSAPPIALAAPAKPAAPSPPGVHTGEVAILDLESEIAFVEQQIISESSTRAAVPPDDPAGGGDPLAGLSLDTAEGEE